MVPLQEIHATNGHDLFKFYQDFVHTGLWTHFIIFCPNSQEENCSTPCKTRAVRRPADPLLCPALRRNRTKQRSAAIKRRERLPFDRGAAARGAVRLLELKCSLPQCDSFFKGPFSIFTENGADFRPKSAAGSVQDAQKRDAPHPGRIPSASCLTRTGDTLINSQVL